jgi:hypothetical protein
VKRVLNAKLLVAVAALGVLALVVVGTAGAAATFPTSAVNTAVGSYGDAILSGLVSAFTAVWPYAAVVTAVAVVAGMIRRWIGSRRATHV